VQILFVNTDIANSN